MKLHLVGNNWLHTREHSWKRILPLQGSSPLCSFEVANGRRVEATVGENFWVTSAATRRKLRDSTRNNMVSTILPSKPLKVDRIMSQDHRWRIADAAGLPLPISYSSELSLPAMSLAPPSGYKIWHVWQAMSNLNVFNANPINNQKHTLQFVSHPETWHEPLWKTLIIGAVCPSSRWL